MFRQAPLLIHFWKVLMAETSRLLMIWFFLNKSELITTWRNHSKLEKKSENEESNYVNGIWKYSWWSKLTPLINTLRTVIYLLLFLFLKKKRKYYETLTIYNTVNSMKKNSMNTLWNTGYRRITFQWWKYMVLLHFFSIVAVKAPNRNLFIRKTKRALPIMWS